MTISVSDEVFIEFRDFIYKKSGIFIPDNKKYFLETRLSRRIQELNLKGFEDYLYSFRHKPDQRELQRVFDLITTNETFFFREPQQFKVFGGELLNRIVDENVKTGRRDIKIWSAASSTGEEPYTISIIILEKPELSGFKTDITASDINESVLTSAREGMYGSYAVRNIPGPYLNKYFNNAGRQYNLSSVVKSMVNFSRVNLLEEKDVGMMGANDVVFCRNVLIYFDDKAKQKVISHLYDAVRPGGYLFIGVSESLHRLTRAFRPVIMDRVIVYQKV